jgi:hypothetical protein
MQTFDRSAMIKSLAAGFANYVDHHSLIGFTMRDATRPRKVVELSPPAAGASLTYRDVRTQARSTRVGEALRGHSTTPA